MRNVKSINQKNLRSFEKVITLQLKSNESEQGKSKRNMKLYTKLSLLHTRKGTVVMNGIDPLTHGMNHNDARALMDRLSKIQKFR